MQNGPDFDKMIEPFVEIYQNVELDIIKHIAAHFKLYESIGFKNSMEWYTRKIEELGGLTQETINIISKQTKIPKSKIVKMLKEIGMSTVDPNVVDKLNNSRDFKININKLKSSESFLNIVENSYKEINRIFKLINTKAIEGANQAYMDILNKAYISVKSGAFDYNTAIRKALSEMTNKGIKVASYKQKNGKVINYGIESCVRRDVLTTVVQCTNKASENFAKEMKAEYYEISQHLGARDTGTHDYKDHSWWQGKILKIEGSTKQYPNFQETCNEGDVQGLGGANCRHIKWAFWLGISVPKKVEISPEENKRLYELSQTQRGYERTIRDYKRHIEVAKASNDNEKYNLYKIKLKNIDEEYNQFCNDNNLRRKYAREDIINNQIQSKQQEKDNIQVNLNRIDKDYQNKIKDVLNHVNEKYPLGNDLEVKTTTRRGRFGQASSGLEFHKVKNQNAYNLKFSNEIRINKISMQNEHISTQRHLANYARRNSKLTDSLATVYHEYGHIIDFNYAIKAVPNLQSKIDNLEGIYSSIDAQNITNDAIQINRLIFSGGNNLSDKIWYEMKNIYNVTDRQMKSLISTEFGTYATTSKKEFLAEGFANMMTLKDKSDFLKKFEQIFNKEYNNIFKE